MPDFMIVGAQKSGTTSLAYYLSRHPQVVASFRKEVHYFDGGLNPEIDTYEQSIDWYRAHFPFRRSLGSGRVCGEASPSYMFHPLAPERIHSVLPDVKLIALLRNPTERAISHYYHVRRFHKIQESLMAALMAEDEQIAAALRTHSYKSDAFLLRSFKSRGLYKQQLETCLHYFSRQQLLVLCSETFFDNPALTLKKTFEFLGIDPNYTINAFPTRNKGHRTSQKSDEVYEYLNNYFGPHNQALYEFLGEDFGW